MLHYFFVSHMQWHTHPVRSSVSSPRHDSRSMAAEKVAICFVKLQLRRPRPPPGADHGAAACGAPDDSDDGGRKKRGARSAAG